MNDKETICEECEHSHPENKHRQPYSHMCMKFPRMEGFGFVTRTRWDKFDPWMYCVGINGGACPLFEERKGNDKRTSVSG